MKRVLAVACLGVAALAVNACTKAEAKTPGPTPIALKVPEPPTRLNIPVTVEAPPPPAPATEKPAPPATPPGTTTRPRPTPTPTPPAGNAETTPPPVVQSADPSGQKARAEERLAVAERAIEKVKRESLTGEARDQFDSAKRFISMTKQALTARNFVYAFYCADKAATLAALLVRDGGRL